MILTPNYKWIALLKHPKSNTSISCQTCHSSTLGRYSFANTQIAYIHFHIATMKVKLTKWYFAKGVFSEWLYKYCLTDKLTFVFTPGESPSRGFNHVRVVERNPSVDPLGIIFWEVWAGNIELYLGNKLGRWELENCIVGGEIVGLVPGRLCWWEEGNQNHSTPAQLHFLPLISTYHQ